MLINFYGKNERGKKEKKKAIATNKICYLLRFDSLRISAK